MPPIPIPTRFQNTSRARSSASRPAARWKMSSDPRAVISGSLLPRRRERGRKTPGVAERIDDAAIARAPERIPRRHRDGGAGFRCALPRRRAGLDLEMHRHRCALDLLWWKHRVHHPLWTAVLGKVIHHENPRAANVNFRMHQALAVLCWHPHHLSGAKRPLVELDRGIGVVDDKMRRDDLY